MKILYITSQIDWPLPHGAAIRRWNILQGLLAAGSTDVLVFSDGDSQHSRCALQGCQRVVHVARKHLRPSLRASRMYQSTLGRLGLALTTPLPLEFTGADRRLLRSRVQQEFELTAYDLIWFNTARTAFAVGPIAAPATVLDGDDFEYVREGLLLRSTAWYGAKVANYINLAKLWCWERNLNRHFSVVVRCSAEDRARHPADNVEVIPNGTNIPASVSHHHQQRLLFVGLMNYPPNVQGISWFRRNVWPLIRERQPSACLDIVGKDPPPEIAAWHGQQGIAVHGFVPELAPFYGLASASIAPLHSGSGTRLKILESLAFGVPVVSTILGAYGLDVQAPLGVERAATPEEFAEQCVTHLRRPTEGWTRAELGRQYVQEHYDWRIVRHSVANLARRFDLQKETISAVA
ncbi:MAG: glycosyltransferase [Planctomycetales bacterium]|nr:glycosyltransferase [Planctomycetales bacterium]